MRPLCSLLLTLGLGKFAQLLGGSGQGTFFDGAWAVAFAPPGPWVSPLPGVPAHPAQVYEGLWLLAGSAASPSVAFVGRRELARAQGWLWRRR